MKQYVLIAGVNGAGKSTLYQTFNSLKDMKRINTDEILRSFGDWRNSSDVLKAGKIAVQQIKEYFEKGVTFNQETTLCGNSIMRNVNTAKKLGYEIQLHYIGVDSVDIAKERIAFRVKNGGHGISDEDVERRYVNSFKALKQIMSMCDMVVLYDNTYSFNRFAVYKEGKCMFLSDNAPNWYEEYIME